MKPDDYWLAGGIGSVGLVLGLMVGASATPVVAVAVPTIFALAAGAVGLIQSSQVNKDLAETIKSLGKQGREQPELAVLREHLRTAPRRLGLALLVFSICFLLGAVLGSTARVAKWQVADRTAPPLPWQNNPVRPPTAQGALEWIAVQHQLRELGYGQAEIEKLYDIQALEWKRGASGVNATPALAPPAAAARPAERPASGAGTKQGQGITDILPGIIGPTNPLANEPRIRQKLDEGKV